MEENKNTEPEQQPENIPEEVISSEQIFLPETEEQPLTDSTDNMEVHHHTHATHGKKNWKAYFWEFLMLFLAVFCGFLAEYKLEQTIERHREKEYIVSIHEDIQTDLAQAEERLKEYATLELMQDSLMDELANIEVTRNSNRAYHLWRSNYGFNDFVYNDRTIQQLKNSGALRMIRNEAVSTSIMKYDQAIRNVQSTQLIMNNNLAGNQVYHRLFDFIKLKLNFKLEIPVPLTEQGSKILNEAYANRENWKDALGFLIIQLKKATEEGRQTMAIIKKEYHLE